MNHSERDETVCFTGHRRIADTILPDVRRITEDAVRALVNVGYSTFLLGGAIGFDTIAQQAVEQVRAELPYIRIRMIIPCENQDARWSERDRAAYRALRHSADEQIVLSPVYTDGCMLARDRYMVDHSSFCVAFYNGKNMGGTAYTVRYALSQNIPIRNLWTHPLLHRPDSAAAEKNGPDEFF